MGGAVSIRLAMKLQGSTATKLHKGWVSFHTFVTPSSSGKKTEKLLAGNGLLFTALGIS